MMLSELPKGAPLSTIPTEILMLQPGRSSRFSFTDILSIHLLSWLEMLSSEILEEILMVLADRLASLSHRNSCMMLQQSSLEIMRCNILNETPLTDEFSSRVFVHRVPACAAVSVAWDVQLQQSSGDSDTTARSVLLDLRQLYPSHAGVTVSCWCNHRQVCGCRTVPMRFSSVVGLMLRSHS